MLVKAHIELKSDNGTKTIILDGITPREIAEKLEGVTFSFWGDMSQGVMIRVDDISNISFEQIEEDDEQ